MVHSPDDTRGSPPFGCIKPSAAGNQSGTFREPIGNLSRTSRGPVGSQSEPVGNQSGTDRGLARLRRAVSGWLPVGFGKGQLRCSWWASTGTPSRKASCVEAAYIEHRYSLGQLAKFRLGGLRSRIPVQLHRRRTGGGTGRSTGSSAGGGSACSTDGTPGSSRAAPAAAPTPAPSAAPAAVPAAAPAAHLRRAQQHGAQRPLPPASATLCG